MQFIVNFCFYDLVLLLLVLSNHAAPLVATSPIAAHPQEPSARSSMTSAGGSHSNFVLIIGIAVGLSIILAVAMTMICACTLRQGNSKASDEVGDKDTGMYIYVSFFDSL